EKPQPKKSPVRTSQVSFGQFFSSFESFFFSSQIVLGLDIGTSYIKILQLKKSRGSYLIADYRVRTLPLLTKDSVSERRDLVVSFVREFISDIRLKPNMGRIVMWGEGTYVFSFTMSAVSEKDLKSAVQPELKKKLPFHVDMSNIIYNFFVTDKLDTGKSTIFQVTCIVVDRDVLNQNIKLLKDIGLRPVVISLIPDAIGNLVAVTAKQLELTAVLDMGTKESVFNFYKKGSLQFSRQLPMGGDQFTQAIKKAMVSAGMMSVTDESVEKVKHQCGIPLEDEIALEYFTDFGVIKGGQISTAFRPLLERFNSEVVRTVHYYYRTFRVNKIDCLYLTGGSARLKNIDKFLFANLQSLHINLVDKLNPLKAVKGWIVTGEAKHNLVMEGVAPHLGAAFGLCIGQGGRINLLPVQEKVEQIIGFLTTAIKVGFIMLLFIITAMFIFSKSRNIHCQQLIVSTEAEIARLVPNINKINAYLTIEKELAQRKSLLTRAIGRQPLWSGILKELSNITPKGIVLKRLQIDRKQEKRVLLLIGEVLAEYTTVDLAISQYLVSLDASPYFVKVKPLSTERDFYSPIPKAQFEIECEMIY
ncbi:MAG: pilus assembly protein PilM, partial [Candidatus Omnitrophota bacterium]